MKKLYIANDIIEAQLLDSVLKNHGLSSFLRNATLQSGVGELPFVETWPEVWIKESKEWEEAVEILSEYKRANIKVDWICSDCNECNPRSFQICWLCNGLP